MTAPIPADHISFNADGTAWLIADGTDCSFQTCGEPAHCTGDEALDRPCDACDGARWQGRPAIIRCDCIDGRHTFTIEVERTPGSHGFGIGNLRVSVLPGMVLPIVDDPPTDVRHFIARWNANATPVEWVLVDRDNASGPFITLPPAAARLLAEGKRPHAGKLKVAS